MIVKCTSCQRQIHVDFDAIIATRLIALGHTPQYAWRVAQRTPEPKIAAGITAECPCCTDGCHRDPCASRINEAVNSALDVGL